MRKQLHILRIYKNVSLVRNLYMKSCMIAVLLGSFLLSISAPSVSAQEQEEPPTIPELAAKEAERLESLLHLEYWQVFYVDSTLQHDYQALQDELEGLQKAKVTNSSIYIAVQDKWMERIDSTYLKLFNDDQWKAYLKSGAAKQQKARAKRKVQAEGKVTK